MQKLVKSDSLHDNVYLSSNHITTHLSSIDYILQLSFVYILTISTSLMHSLSEREQLYKHEMCVYFTKIYLHQERVYIAAIFNYIFAHIDAMVWICSPKCSPFNMLANGVF